ncbi:aminodeoxychorismate synthase component I [Alteripontixanthobacter maritimus]
MAKRQPFLLLDDARENGAADAHLFSGPREMFIARRADEVAGVLTAADDARRTQGGTLAGIIAYEAGLALEPRLSSLADDRTGAAGPLVWLGLFYDVTIIPAGEVDGWLAAQDSGESGSGSSSLGPLGPQISPGAYLEKFAAMQEAIRAGDIYQANLTFPLAGSFTGDPVALYRALRQDAKAGYGGLLFDGSHWLASLSPELFFTHDRSAVKVKPMKGTRPRGRDAAEDAALAEDLAGSVKDKAENLMIVDLMRNDLSRVAQPGSVRVDAPFAVESYPTVHQMVSTVRATLADGKTAMDLVRAIFPCGSITGAPKIRAMELISAIERDARGAYCGAMGRIGVDGSAAFNVAIRTLRLTEIENGRGDAVLGVGSAIVADSDPMDEWRECILKGGFARASSARGSSVRASVAGFDLIETMRFEPETGIPLLELHLERMKASAIELGFSFDRHAARNQIQALCFDHDASAKLRLQLARSGHIALELASLPAESAVPLPCIALPLPVGPGDWRLRHKTTDREFYEDAREIAAEAGADEALFVLPDGSLTEGAWSSIFVERDGALLTPPAASGLLPGVLRRSLMEQGRATEARLTLDDLADGFSLGNAVRGLMKAKLLP